MHFRAHNCYHMNCNDQIFNLKVLLLCHSSSKHCHNHQLCVTMQACSQGGSVGSEELPSHLKGPLFLMKGPPFEIRSPCTSEN